MMLVIHTIVTLFVSDTVRSKERVLPITTSDGAISASGVLLDRFTVLTAAHTVGAEQSTVFLRCGEAAVAGVVTKRAKAHDLALIHLYTPCYDVQAAELAHDAPEEGCDVRFDGYPSGVLKHGTGRIRGYSLFSLKKQLGLGPGIFWVAMVIDGDVRPGNSGGPVFANGKLVGIVHGYHESTEGKPGVVVPLSAIAQFLSE
jgi:S1-C subfamily serine protease